jgi:hypothetical protein
MRPINADQAHLRDVDVITLEFFYAFENTIDGSSAHQSTNLPSSQLAFLRKMIGMPVVQAMMKPDDTRRIVATCLVNNFANLNLVMSAESMGRGYVHKLLNLQRSWWSFVTSQQLTICVSKADHSGGSRHSLYIYTDR